MKKLKEDFKRMLNGLAYQNVGDCLSRKEKIEILSDNSKNTENDMIVETTVTSVAAVHQVVSTSNDEAEVLEQSAA